MGKKGVDGTVTIAYRPLETMDRLHVLLAEAATIQTSSVDYIARIFSLPTRMVRRELAVLEGYGLCCVSRDGVWLTDRGVEVVSTWNEMGKAVSMAIETSGEVWRLGPGSFSVPGTVRGIHSCLQQARQHGISTLTEAMQFIRKRHEREEDVSRFVERARPTWDARQPTWTEHADAINGKVSAAETNEAIDALRELLHSLCERHNDESDEFLKERSAVFGAFTKQATAKRQENRKSALVKRSCEAWLIRAWVTRAARQFLKRFDDEPGAFRFDSSVPVIVAAEKPEPFRRQTAPQTHRRTEPVGFLRSIIRWLLGKR